MTTTIAAETRLDRARESWARADSAEADRLCREILAGNQDNADALHLLAEIRLAAAPESPVAHMLMAHALRRLGRPNQALPHAERAVSAAPDNVEAHMMLGMALQEAGRVERAAAAFQAAVAVDPAAPQPQLNLGTALTDAGRADDAVEVLRALADRHPTFTDAWLQLGNAHRERGDPEAAVDSYRQAVAIAPKDARAHSNLGVALQQCGAFDDAANSLDTAIRIDPTRAEAHKNRAMLRLLRGDFARGFEEFAWRWRQDGPVNRARPFPQPDWDGGPLTGKTILVWSEQGVGDEIMFASVLPEIIETAGRVLIECETRLVPLFARSFPAAEVFARTDPPHQRLKDDSIDMQCAGGDACRWLRRDRQAFGSPPAYLQAEADRTCERRAAYDAVGQGLKIGIAWRSRTPLWGAIKSAPLDHLAPILCTPGAQWINLQYGDCAAEIERINNQFGVKIHQDSDINQFADLDRFAAQVAALDLVVSTSNTAAHMAGALGVPTLLLLPSVPDWRWQDQGDTALWYPDMTLFRQRVRGDWSSPIEAAAAELSTRISALSTNR